MAGDVVYREETTGKQGDQPRRSGPSSMSIDAAARMVGEASVRSEAQQSIEPEGVLLRRDQPIAPTTTAPAVPNISIVHDYLTQRGGAERVVIAILKAFPLAPLYVSLHHPEGTYPEF